jgi:hypothetical protein
MVEWIRWLPPELSRSPKQLGLCRRQRTFLSIPKYREGSSMDARPASYRTSSEPSLLQAINRLFRLDGILGTKSAMKSIVGARRQARTQTPNHQSHGRFNAGLPRTGWANRRRVGDRTRARLSGVTRSQSRDATGLPGSNSHRRQRRQMFKKLPGDRLNIVNGSMLISGVLEIARSQARAQATET